MDGKVRLWKGTPVAAGRRTQPQALAPSAAAIWDMVSGGLLRAIPIGHDQSSAQEALSADGSLLAAAAGPEGRVGLWNPATGDLLRALPGSGGPPVTALAVSTDGSVVAGAAAMFGRSDPADGIRLWDGHTGALKQRVAVSEGSVRSLAFSPEGGMLAVGLDLGAAPDSLRQKPGQPFQPRYLGAEIRLVDLGSAAVHHVPLAEGSPAYGGVPVAFSPDGRLVAGGPSHSVRVCDARTGATVQVLKAGQAEAIGFSPDGSILAVGGGDRVALWSLRSGALLRTLGPVSGYVRGVAFLPDGHRIVASSTGGTTMWDIRTGKERLRLLAFPSSEGRLAVGEWLTHTPEGYYSASPSAGIFFQWRVDGPVFDERFPASRYDKEYRQAGKVREALAEATQ